MIRQNSKVPENALLRLLLVLVMCGLSTTAFTRPLAEIEILPMSPRTITYGGNAAFTQKASGLNTVPIGNKVYMQAEVTSTALISYKWQIVSKPTGSVATLSSTTGTLSVLTPDKVGAYKVALIPVLNSKLTTASVQVIRAATFLGAGVPNTQGWKPTTPACGSGYCHGGNNAEARLNVTANWLQSKHATKMTRHLNGSLGENFKTSCLSCHNTGFDTTAGAVNGGYDDVAAAIGFNTAQIVTLVNEAAQTGLDRNGDVPLALQKLQSIQCESCHGPGSQHPSNLSAADHGISGANLDPKACAQCHDAPTHHQIYWQWQQSTHDDIHTIEHGHVVESSSCVRCHSGDEFVRVQIKGLGTGTGGRTGIAYTNTPDAHSYEKTTGATCSVCHDPHYTANPHQLRSLTFKYDTDETFNGTAGLGGLCMKCHQGRVSGTNTSSVSSHRGIHGAAQTDMLDGKHGYVWGETLSSSAHRSVVPDSCVTCHMAEPTVHDQATPPKVGGHTMALIDDMGTTTTTADDVENAEHACGECHTGLTTLNRTARQDYDGDGLKEGVQNEVKGLMAILLPKIQEQLPTSVTLNEIGKIVPVPAASGTGDLLTVTYNKFNANQKGAIYNYNFVLVDGSYGIHNTAYAVQLLQKSYQYLTGHSITQDYPNVVVRNMAPMEAPVPVEMSEFSAQ